MLNSPPRLYVISPGFRNKLKDTLYISLFNYTRLSSEAFLYYIRGRTLDNILNYGPGKPYFLPNLTITSSLPTERAYNYTSKYFLVLIRFMVLKNK